ncbi:hypothetical protein CDFC105_73150 [Clostridioides difficile]|nr:hypothetical protein CDFC105_60659 [Clostridioides difficile]CZR95943.1 hypothetical protein CDFC105_60732 [Clostridioides difficile]CZS09288.1 hypothetical protein CDFC105_73077 [Clostridioides difficile]CZS09487.1 hypothetical protein CDFC105_73150 [Clostridioides difficile]
MEDLEKEKYEIIEIIKKLNIDKDKRNLLMIKNYIVGLLKK